MAMEPHDTASAGDLMVVMTGFPSDRGWARVALSDTAEGFPRSNPAVRDGVVPIRGGRAVWRVAGLPFGEYTVRFFHDENDNGEFDTGFLGIPREGYGFSNNARPRFGPPSYHKARFQVRRAAVTMELVVQGHHAAHARRHRPATPGAPWRTLAVAPVSGYDR